MILLLMLALQCAPTQAAAVTVAGSVVRSKQWVIRRGNAKEEEFIGDVRYQSAGRSLSADWALYTHRDRTWQARGAITVRHLFDDGSQMTARGQFARHNEEAKQGFMQPAPGGRIRFTRTLPGGEPDYGDGGRVSWNDERTVTISSGVKIWGPRLEVASDTAIYDRLLRQLTLRGGRPVVHTLQGEWIAALKADEIDAYESPRRLDARGAASGWILFSDTIKLEGSPK
ncbi:MAG: hypothetical protein AAB036_02095 [Elusimicrobiota bacterium]